MENTFYALVQDEIKNNDYAFIDSEYNTLFVKDTCYTMINRVWSGDTGDEYISDDTTIGRFMYGTLDLISIYDSKVVNLFPDIELKEYISSKYDKFYNVLDDDAIDEIKEIVQNELGCDGLKDVPVWDYEDSGFDNDYGVILFDPNKSLKKVIDAKFEECEEMTDDLKYFLEETEKKEYHIETYNDNGKKIDDLEIKIPKGIMLPYIMYINDNYNYNDNIRIDWIIDAIESLGYISVTLGNVIANIDDNLEMFYNFVEGYDYDIGSFLETVKKYNEYVIDTLLDYFVKKYKLPDPHDNKYDEFSIIEMI